MDNFLYICQGGEQYMLQDKVISYLEHNQGKVVTGGEMSERFGVSRTAIWKAVHALQEKGHDIEALKNSGYKLSRDSDGLSKQIISSLLTTQKFGRELEVHEILASTNTYLKEITVLDTLEGYTVVADGQSHGRGRLGRTFYSPLREGIYLSILLKPDLELQNVSMITICAAVAVCRALSRVCNILANIKWVNDIFVNGKKMCGILSEASVSAELQTIESVIVGIGLNTGTVDPIVSDIATSVLEKTGAQGQRNRLIAEVLNQFENVYSGFLERGEKEKILQEYAEKLLFIKKQVQIKEGGKSYQATILGVDETGALLVDFPTGISRRVTSGEII